MASDVNVVSSNPYIGPLPIIKIYFTLLSICTVELISALRRLTFFTMLPWGNEREFWTRIKSYVIAGNLYLTVSAFLVSFTSPNKPFLE